MTGKAFLAIGLRSPEDSTQKLAYKAEDIARLMKSQTELLAARGIRLDGLPFDINQPQDALIDELTATLRAADYDGVSIGFGVRGNVDYTVLFERMCNAIVRYGRRSDGGPPVLMFAVKPDGIADCIDRAFPGLMESK